MTGKIYIEEKLRSLASLFDDIHIKYEYRPAIKSHLIEIIPSEFMVENEDYFKQEAKLEEEFEQLFPDESLIFISDDDSLTIENPDLEIRL